MKHIAWLALALLACGGRVSQAPACATYVACVRATDAPQQRTTNLDRFLADGACWSNADTGELCQTGCERALRWLKARTAELPAECTP